EVQQVVYPQTVMKLDIPYLDLRQEQQPAEKLKELINKELQTPFHLSQGPLLRAGLYQVEEEKWVFYYAMHHIVSDGWSMGILIRELLLLYEAHIRGAQPSLAPLKIHYKDYAAWQQDRLQENQLLSGKTYWLKQMEGELPELNLPVNTPRPKKTYQVRTINKIMDADRSYRLKSLCRGQGGTLFMGLLATVNLLLNRYTKQQDIIIGSPIAGREHPDLEDQIGFYLNTLALRTRFAEEDSFLTLFNKVKEVTLGAYEHQNYPFDELVDALNLQKPAGRNFLFDVWLVLHNAGIDNDADQRQINKLKISKYEFEGDLPGKFDLLFSFIEIREELHVSIEYNTGIFNKKEAEELADQMDGILNYIMDEPETTIAGINQKLDKIKEEKRSEYLQAVRKRNSINLKKGSQQ
ncbi:MAG TPA: condensation domain-containing protein, partial [Puia sp.]|nr:condensation domain-containing protein [Puia sp.]